MANEIIDYALTAKTTVRLMPGTTLGLHDLPPRGVALDGCVQGPHSTAMDQWSFDHHDNCMRLITLATCEQVRNVLCLGGLGWFDGRTVFVNDLDGDTLLSLWLIRRAHQGNANHPDVRTLVRAVGAIDAHGPAGSLLLSPEESRLAMRYYQHAIKRVTELRGRVREEFNLWPELLEQSFDGIDHVFDPSPDVSEGARPDPVIDIHFRASLNSQRVLMGTCEGFGFPAAYDQGYDAAVLFTPAADGSTTYTIAKRSDLVGIPVGPVSDPQSILGRLAALEPGWGGGSSIGGSPRLPEGVSSRLTPEQVWAVVTAS